MKNEKTNATWIRFVLPAVLTVAGAVGGYLYYRFVGCADGTCAITSNPLISTVYGGVIGFLLGVTVTPGKCACKGACEDGQDG